MTPSLVLASQSASRARLLRNAGLTFEVRPARIDERTVKESMQAEQSPPGDAAQALADLKALRVSSSESEALVIGADQILECDGVWFDKPPDLDAARDQLHALSGHSHQLWTAAAVAKDGSVIWRDLARNRMTMRDLSGTFVDEYLNEEKDRVLSSVGAYQIEGRGIQLFSAMSGDFFSILGLPLLSLLNFLRGHDAVPT